MKPFAISAAIIAALLASPGLAAPLAAPLAFDGAYQFTTTERENGIPVCTETWTFAAPDRMTVTSGEEVVEKRFRTENDRDGDWLVARSLATNGKPDCMGNISDPPAPNEAESRISILRFNDGSMLVCPPPGHTDDGIPVHGQCYASLYKLR